MVSYGGGGRGFDDRRARPYGVILGGGLTSLGWKSYAGLELTKELLNASEGVTKEY